MQDKIENFFEWIYIEGLDATSFQAVYVWALGLLALYLLFRWKLHPAIEYYIDNPKFEYKHTLYCFMLILPAPLTFIISMLSMMFFITVFLVLPAFWNGRGGVEEIDGKPLYWKKFKNQLIIHSLVYNTLAILLSVLIGLIGCHINNKILIECSGVMPPVLVIVFFSISSHVYEKRRLINK